MNGKTDRLQLIFAMAIFGTIGIVRRYIPYPSSVIALVRAVVGALFLIIVHICRRKRFSGEALRNNFILLCVSGALLGANWICLFEAYSYTTVSVATMCYYMAPVFVILLSPIFLREVLTLKKGICSGVAVCGMILVSGISETGIGGIRGVVFGLVAAIMYASVILINKFIHNLSANERTLFQLVISAIALIPYVMITEEIGTLETGGFVIAMLAVAGIVHTGIAYVLYFGSIKSIPAQTVALFSYIDPVVAVILSVAVLKESMTVSALIGVVMVIGAMVASTSSDS